MPGVIGHRGVIEEVGLDHPVNLQVLEMFGDALEEALADIRIVRGRIRLSVMRRDATLRPAAVRSARPVVLIVGVAVGELTVKSVIYSEKPSTDVDLVVVVRVASKTVPFQRVAFTYRHAGNA